MTSITVDVANQTFTYLDEDNNPTTVDIAALETTTTVTNTVAGNPIATYRNEEDADVVINETITTLTTTTDEFTFTNELGATVTVDLAPYLDNTDDQQITAFDYDDVSNDITITLEDGGTRTINLDELDNAGTDDQALSLAGNTLTLEDGGTVDLAPYLDNTDDQQITAFDYDDVSNDITITLENGGTRTINLDELDNTGTDDQTLTYTNTDPDDNVNTLQIEGSTAFNIDDNHLGTDDQTLTEDRDINLSTNDLRVNSADGRATFTNSGNLILNDATNPIFQAEDTRNGVQTRLQSSNTVGIIGTASAHSLQIRTDNTTVGQFETSGRFRLNSYGSGAFTGTVTNILGVSSNGTILEVDALSLNTDEQDLSLSSNILSLTNDPTTVDLTPYLDNTDDQALSLSGNTLTLEDGGTVNLTPYLDNTDNQQITDFDLNATTNVLTITLEDGGTQDVDLSVLDNACLLYTSPSPRDQRGSRMPSSA